MTRAVTRRLPQGGRIDRRRQVAFTLDGRPMTGYAGDIRPEMAQIILPRLSLSGASNDIGFAYEDGSWTAIVSEYDRRSRYGDCCRRSASRR